MREGQKAQRQAPIRNADLMLTKCGPRNKAQSENTVRDMPQFGIRKCARPSSQLEFLLSQYAFLPSEAHARGIITRHVRTRLHRTCVSAAEPSRSVGGKFGAKVRSRPRAAKERLAGKLTRPSVRSPTGTR